MGRTGPPPKRVDKRLGHTSKAARQAVQKAATTAGVEPPASDENWHPIARMWFESLASSGQSAFYTAGDWLTAYTIAESMSREFKPQPITVGSGQNAHVEMVELPPKAASLAAWLKGMTGLLVLEGDRRRVSLELERTPTGGAKEEAASVSSLDSWRTRIDGTG